MSTTHRGLSVARAGRRPGHGPGVDGARVHRDDEPLPAPPRHPCRPGRVGASQHSGARRGHRSGGEVRMTKEEPRPTSRVGAGQTGFPSGGAEGIRTPDLLIANETRYQLRHSPETPVEPARAEKIPPGSASPESGQEPTARWCSVSAATSASASSAAAWATIWVSSAVRPDVQVPGSPRSMVRTVRLALGFET